MHNRSMPRFCSRAALISTIKNAQPHQALRVFMLHFGLDPKQLRII
jgi:hypothetical protein